MDNKSDTIKIASQKSSSNKSFKSNLVDCRDSRRRWSIERHKTQEKVQKLKEHKKQIHGKYLRNELQKKKKELQQLKKSQTIKDVQHQAFHNAKLKSQKVKLNKQKQLERAQTADKIAKERYQQALKRLSQQEQQKNIKKTIAQQIRYIHSQKQTQQRKQTSDYRKIIQLKAKQNDKQLQNEAKMRVIDYRNTLNKHGLNQKLTATNYNPTTFVVIQNQAVNQAMNKADIEGNRKKYEVEKKQQLDDKNRKIAIDRGEKVLKEMQRQKEYEAYCFEVEKEQQKYNLKRIQAGKHNQFAGVKPLTVSQMTINKKIRSEQQFEEMFIRAPLTNLNNKTASKYKITETKMIDQPQQVKITQKWIKQPINYLERQSLIPENSEAHYSFQESKSSLKDKSNKYSFKQESQIPIKAKSFKKQENNSGIVQDLSGKKIMKETRMQNNPRKKIAELSYSDSDQQDSNI